ncbi:c-type cytochrome [Sinorhizobium alkalisoli]|uniref:c-type cytochrome n=1 Tax=Sinorhizobium alkalisoli TaxID=1752398 RepID=UPI00124F6904|nr:cytochrome c family protein [Sinorhizobium alkalisoli]
MWKFLFSLAIVSSATAQPGVAADGDPVTGKKVFGRCAACHLLDQERHAVGPYLRGIVGRPIASVSTFKYSSALTKYAEGGRVWDENSLATFLHSPKKAVPGTRMGFAGLKNDQEIRDLITYLSRPQGGVE